MGKRSKIVGISYWHRPERGYYADFRKWSDVGGKRRKVGDTLEEAQERIVELRDEYANLRQRATSLDGGDPKLIDLAKDHLRKKRSNVKEKTLEGAERSLRHLIGFLGTDAHVSDVTVRALSEFIEWRLDQPGYRGKTLRPSTVRVDLAHISSLCRSAVAYGCLEANPVAKIPNRPKVAKKEPEWLERDEAGRVMEASRKLCRNQNSRCYSYLFELISTLLLTGGRSKEVRGLMLRDVDFENGRVHFRPNGIRGLKRQHHRRTVPLWPQLSEILTQHRENLSGNLLFPSTRRGANRIVTEIRQSLDTVLKMADITKRVTLHTFRHTYTANRMQTTDQGAPISPYTVMRELGHRNLDQIVSRYGHLLDSRTRAPAVSYAFG